jgi:hypothetical protein
VARNGIEGPVAAFRPDVIVMMMMPARQHRRDALIRRNRRPHGDRGALARHDGAAGRRCWPPGDLYLENPS